jgi:DNA invertase Pin-like site-specific DNA recombinase
MGEEKRRVYVPKEEKKHETVINCVEEEVGPRTIGYLRVSTEDQDLEKNKSDILDYANNKGFVPVQWVEEKISGYKTSWQDRKIKGVIDELGKDDRIIVPELSRLGRSMLEIMEILSVAKRKDISIYDVKNGWELNGNLQSSMLAMCFSIASEVERDLISKRTTEALRIRKAMGVKLGRPKGPGKSKLDEHREEIIALLKNGTTKAFIARRYKTTVPNLFNWLRKNDLNIKAE